MDEFKYTRDLVNSIRNNTISEISAKKGLNTLNEIKNAEIIKYKKCTPKQKELLNLFNDLLDAIITDKTLKSKSQKDKILMSSKDENENEKENEKKKGNEKENKNENKNENENNKTLMSSNDDDDNENNKTLIIIRNLNDYLDKIIDKSKSFDDQIKSIKQIENLDEYYFINHYGDKELKFKIFKVRLAHLSNIIDEKLFKQIFGHKF